MDLFNTVLQLLNNPSSSFLIGIAAAFTPCTLAIFPIFLYRFGLWGKEAKVKKNYIGFGVASVSFIISFAITGVLLQQIIVSELANVFRLTLGTMLIFVGIMQLSGKLNLQTISGFSNPIAMGATLPWIISFSPCVLAFTASLLVSGSGATAAAAGSTALQFTLFGAGMLLPVAILVFLGNAAMSLMRKSHHLMDWVERLSPYLIIGSGIYLSSQLVQITSVEVVGTGVALLLITGLIVYKTLQKPAYRNQINAVLIGLMLFSLLGITLISRWITLPYDATALKGKDLLFACIPGSHLSSPVAWPLAIMFAIYALILAGWYQVHDRQWKIKLDFGITAAN